MSVAACAALTEGLFHAPASASVTLVAGDLIPSSACCGHLCFLAHTDHTQREARN